MWRSSHGRVRATSHRYGRTVSVIDDRHIPFDTVFNFRDLGGYETADGRRIRMGRLYRADGIHRLEGDDIGRVRDLGIRCVIDLRTAGELERGRFPVDDHPVDHHHLPVISEIWPEDALVERAEDYLAARYIDMLTSGTDAFVGALEVMASSDNFPLVFHCAAGKDRTGIVAALLLSVLGVDDELIAADYAVTAEHIDELDARYGGIERFLREQCSVDASTLSQLRELLID